jgi:hypothetical protein
MKVYIAGRVTGLTREQASRNFSRGEALMRSNNHDPINPLAFVPEGSSPKEAMKTLLPLMLECEAILLLEDWEFSEGAMIESALANYSKMTILLEEDFN